MLWLINEKEQVLVFLLFFFCAAFQATCPNNCTKRLSRQDCLTCCFRSEQLFRRRSCTARSRRQQGFFFRTIVHAGGCTGQDSPDCPDPAAIRTILRPPFTHPVQVKLLFFGFYATLLYQVWVFMGLYGCFHAFLCFLLKFL